MSTSRNTRLAVGVVLACLTVTSGCMGIGDLGSALNINRAEEVTYNANVVSEAPESATVIDTDDLGNASALEPLFTKALESDKGYASLTVRGGSAGNLTTAMGEFPYYRDGGAYYFDHDGTIIRVDRLK
ncbi:hypothetical protein [Halomarina rubra]|uniref:Uncharacterized protein n=1 Tax=Halomarina rubra TaxID=2071873 RepID=A0ABD6AY61_9EURY|nr:hypothetical protein [Halomarina rubra]